MKSDRRTEADESPPSGARVFGTSPSRQDRQVVASLQSIFVVDANGHFLGINPAGAHLLGRPAGEMVGRHFVEFIAPGDRAVVVAELADTVARRLERAAMSFGSFALGERRGFSKFSLQALERVVHARAASKPCTDLPEDSST